ncbi:MAG: UbiX family flavin prenyltransferase [Thermoplasmata archaeon]|nr:UbiX family flavin prenyltransferase [Thermoplasmata archaeon]
MTKVHIVVSMTGASGAGFGFQLIQGLSNRDRRISLIVNKGSLSILRSERGATREDLARSVDRVFDDEDIDNELASGSNVFDHMVICPCTTSTASKIASGIGDTLTTRTASVALKERRELILAIRETPLSTPVLRSLYDLSSWGVIVMPISPSYYNDERTVHDLQVRFSGRIMDLLEIDNDMTGRYIPQGGG